MTLKYVSVPANKIKIGKKYLIHYHMGNFTPYVMYTGMFIRYTTEPRNYIHLYHYGDSYNKEFILSNSKKLICSDVDDFYEMLPQKHKIQSAMELRAINKLLQRIVGDDTFTYL